jgi:hypothetical protein
MIVIDEKDDLIKVGIFGELTLADYQEFERAVTHELATAPKVRLLMDLRKMSGFTIDVAWEEIKFSRAHAYDFQRIAVISDNQWTSWLSWISAAFTDAEIKLFDEADEAVSWLDE